MSVREGASCTKLHIRHVILISGKFRYPASSFPRRCRKKHFFTVIAFVLPSHSPGSQLLPLMLLVVSFPIVIWSVSPLLLCRLLPHPSPCLCSLAHSSHTHIRAPLSFPWILHSRRCLTSFILPVVGVTVPCASKVYSLRLRSLAAGQNSQHR